MKTISSSLTFFYKYIFFGVWSGSVGLATLIMFLFQSYPEMLPKLASLLFWIVGTSLLYLAVGRIKKVQIDEREIIISNYLKTVKVDISSISSVSGTYLLQPELVRIKLKHQTKMGQIIIFMPPVRFSLGLTMHPMVKVIQTLIDNQSN